MVVNGGHILIVDDNEDILTMMRAMLSIKGYTVVTARTREEMEAVIQSDGDALDVIFIDLHIGGTDGREICKGLKADAKHAKLPIVMCTADPVARTSCLRAGADHFLEKPFSMTKLLAVLEEISSE